MVNGGISQTTKSNTPSIASAATALAANEGRLGFSVQNIGQNPLFVRFGDSASTTVFHVVLKAGTANDDGTGGLVSMESGCVYTGMVTVAGTSPRYVASEFAP